MKKTRARSRQNATPTTSIGGGYRLLIFNKLTIKLIILHSIKI